jgi:dTDP-4-dehydrorhamnose reductase
MKVLVTGAHGRLGSRLVELLRVQGEAPIPADTAEFDIADSEAALSFVETVQPEVIIHTAAWTDVDGCARDPERANQINGHGAGNLAQVAQVVGARMIFISSNEVFDGLAERPYQEDDPPRPANSYGYSKWLGEQAVCAATDRHVIIRTSWLFAHGGKNFVQSILNAAVAGNPLKVVTDEVSNPTYNDDLADAILKLMRLDQVGIFHLTNAGYCSRYEFAHHSLDLAGYQDTPIQPITSADWQRPSSPPPFSPLENQRAKALGIELRPWQDALATFLSREGLLKSSLE